ncbi:transmembrane protein, putative (macronuclear) [Tetrahymena thermophila SB210]|uniref:Transmembrane protein, putative n=1 Tax=Tetrahymena thermophila (strain SB210) TaxID=312017 RepID=W7XG29_TETTS|nr:transmembrane protein, putative [Tetrahymena thermophila SB210]EWS75858.1 transmembrane protein, putative [Tetrahymena thermophila SB210]|eukprot:XP_012651614.1 transmembrane protein, putative [Tetrahymena thermophila SB210]
MSQQNVQENKFPVRFNLDQQQKSQIVNDILFTFDEDDEVDNNLKGHTKKLSSLVIQQSPKSTNEIKDQQNSTQSSQGKNQQILFFNTPTSSTKQASNQIRRSSLKAHSKFFHNQAEKDFFLEIKKKDKDSSRTSSKESFSDISESSEEDQDESEEQDCENSPIMNLMKKTFKMTFSENNQDKSEQEEEDDEIQEEVSKNPNNKQLFMQQTKYAVEQILKQINEKEQHKNINYTFDYIDFSSLVFFYFYLIWSNDLATLKTLHQYCQKQISDQQIQWAGNYKAFKNASDYRVNPKEKMKEILEVNSVEDGLLKILVQSYFFLFRQNIFESSIYYKYFHEFYQLSNYLQFQSNEKFEFYIGKGIFELCLQIKDEKYIQIFLKNNYYLELDFSKEKYQYIKACQYTQDDQQKPKLNAFVLIYYFSVENLNPNLIEIVLRHVEDSQALKYIFQHLVTYHLNQFAKNILQKIIAQKQDDEKEIINLCLTTYNFNILFQYYKLTQNKIKGWIEETENQTIMIKALSRCSGYNFQSLLFFIKKIQLWSQKDLINLMAHALSRRLEASKNDQNFLFSFQNPLKIIVLIIEILQITLQNEFFHKNILEKTRKKYTQFAEILIKNDIDEESIFSILVDWDLVGRKLLYIIYENSISELIATDKVQEVIDILWYGSTNNSLNQMNFCSIGQNLTGSTLQKQIADQNSKFIDYPFNREYQSEDFIARLSVWKKQIQFRNFIDQALNIIFMICFLAYFLQSFEIYTEGFMPVNSDVQIVENTINKMQINMSKWIYVNIFVGINLPLNAIVDLIYHQEFEQSVSFDSGQIFDLLFALITNLYTIFVYTMHYYQYDSVQFFMILFLNILTVFCYLKFIFCLTATKSFGIIIQALGVIFKEVAKFFVPFVAIFIIFTFVGYILFNQIDSGRFESFVLSLYYLVEAMFGQFTFSAYQGQYSISGRIFMCLHMYSLNIILMNVLVAILAFNFEKINRQARTLHYQHIISHVRQGNYIQKHGCLILVPILIEFTIIPYLIIKKFFHHESNFIKKCQNFYIYLSYSPVFAITLLFTITINLILLPFAYLQRIFQLTKLYFYGYIKIYKLLIWILIGVFYLLKRLFYDDMKELCSYLLSQKSQADNVSQNQKKMMSDQLMREIFKTVYKIYMNGRIYCTISELFLEIKEDLIKKSESPFDFCLGEEKLVGVHLIDNKKNNRQSFSITSQSIERIKGMRRGSTPLQIYMLQKQNSRNFMQNIDQINVKHTFQGIPQMEEDCEQIYEYFERFCFKDIARGDEKRDFVLNLKNLLKLHENYLTSKLNFVIHFQLYKTIKQQFQ